MRLETIQKYLEALKALKAELDLTDSVNKAQFCKTYHVNTAFFTVLRDGGVISEKGPGRKKKMKWESIPPNVHMAQEALQQCNNMSRRAQNKLRKQHKPNLVERSKKTKDTPTVIMPESVKYTTTSYLWGLVTIKTVYHY